MCSNKFYLILECIFSFNLLIRGEKLYVTKDKRIKSKWRKWLCWAIIVALIGGAAIIGILAACKQSLNNLCILNTLLNYFV